MERFNNQKCLVILEPHEYELDHIIFKTNIYSTLLERNKDVKVVEFTLCRFGKWYYENIETNSLISTMPSFLDMEKPHKAVHNISQNICDLVNDDTLVNHDAILEDIKAMEEESFKLFEIIAKTTKEYENSNATRT